MTARSPAAPAPRTRDRARFAFFASSFLLVFAYGFLVGAENVFPYTLLRVGINAVRQLGAWRTDFGVRPEVFLQPAARPGDGVTRHLEGRSAPGLTLIVAFFGGTHELRLIRADGTVVRRWPVRYFDLFPDSSHVLPPADRPKTEWNVEPHDGLALPDGSVVFNFENKGLVRLDRCGDVVWTLPRMAHHVISPNADGTFWVGGRRYVEGPSPYPPLETPFHEETAMRVSAHGQVLQEISVLKALLDGAPGVFFGGLSNEVPRGDMLHLNDIEELPPNIADRFPRMSAGDLLLSMRDLSLLMVLNPSTGQVVWRRVGRWIRQHDPDFRPDGTITVFSNNPLPAFASPAGARRRDGPLGASTILDLDPVTGATNVVYGGSPDGYFYTPIRGKHEWLSNGNLLIVEANAGRVFEVAPDGEVVWEFLNRYDDRDAAVVYQARRYTEDYFTVSDWNCPSDPPAAPTAAP
ncbi:MAG: arylsulfotransferase family protein [Vicinamibacterales bacterium]